MFKQALSGTMGIIIQNYEKMMINEIKLEDNGICY